MISAVAKSKIYIGSTLPASSVGDYDLDTFVQVKEVEDLGEFGDTFEEVTFLSIEDGRTRKLKGTADAGTIELIVGRDPLDPGQSALRIAAKSDHAYNFRVVLNDSPGPGGSPTEFFFRAMVASSKNQLGGANDIAKQAFTLSITTEILEIPAVEVAA